MLLNMGLHVIGLRSSLKLPSKQSSTHQNHLLVTTRLVAFPGGRSSPGGTESFKRRSSVSSVHTGRRSETIAHYYLVMTYGMAIRVPDEALRRPNSLDT